MRWEEVEGSGRGAEVMPSPGPTTSDEETFIFKCEILSYNAFLSPLLVVYLSLSLSRLLLDAVLRVVSLVSVH